MGNPSENTADARKCITNPEKMEMEPLTADEEIFTRNRAKVLEAILSCSRESLKESKVDYSQLSPAGRKNSRMICLKQ